MLIRVDKELSYLLFDDCKGGVGAVDPKHGLCIRYICIWLVYKMGIELVS